MEELLKIYLQENPEEKRPDVILEQTNEVAMSIKPETVVVTLIAMLDFFVNIFSEKVQNEVQEEIVRLFNESYENRYGYIEKVDKKDF